MEWVALLKIIVICGAGSIGLHLFRQMRPTNADGLAQLAAAGLLTQLAKSGPQSGASPVALARVRALCASVLIPDLSKRLGRTPSTLTRWPE